MHKYEAMRLLVKYKYKIIDLKTNRPYKHSTQERVRLKSTKTQRVYLNKKNE